MNKVSFDYFVELYEKGNIPKIFFNIRNTLDNKTTSNKAYNEDEPSFKTSIFSVFNVIDYLTPKLDQEIFGIKKVQQFFKGYAVNLNGFINVDAYLKFRFRSNAKSIRKKVRRLESCFSISDTMYYGEGIKLEEYDFFMNNLHDMLVRRFDERNDVSQSLLNWERYKEMYFTLINQKKASLFIIEDGAKPIVISLGHHFNGKLFSAISSYDIDYSKFSLGSVEIYKKLEWCLTNNHNAYEMGMGDLSYKREWCNHIYNFEHQIIYPKNNIHAILFAHFEYLKISLKELIFKLAYNRYKKYKTRNKTYNDTELEYVVEDVISIDHENLTRLNLNDDKNALLRRPVYDFLYSNIEKVDEVELLELSRPQNLYFIKGTKKIQKLSFK